MHTPEITGTIGAPKETLSLLLEKSDFNAQTMFIVITDFQGHRNIARYSVLVHNKEASTLSVPAFGPHYGQAGIEALRDVVQTAIASGVTNFKETVVNPYDFQRMTSDPDEADLKVLLSKANPTDYNIYI
ncbi:DUF3197 domain-containing protein [Deinococcus cellulosilyticus]|uniref:Uncharacterized protein n=1 Tax=Deinococcus cellulosilyticus (strain DSM 18568 / NBRC 106333 / KACC 11606 / 5516J-15) TaxID=1223518 RepID=A0A511MXD6_DEIC1|nr:DUF3197 domain-containing protein [Deinococcus cellulosilyticus]GEM45243.1 hypothetical protein DC3_08780 [Deinococcus cellulosilyticus NBRC 106333 = KACC 11606]